MNFPDMPRRRRRLDPLDVLRLTRDPLWAAWAMRAMHNAGFRDVIGIAASCGWRVYKGTELADLLTFGEYA